MDQCNQIELKKKLIIHAIDPETKHWLLAKVLDVNDSDVKVTWSGYSKSYDCWVPRKDVRLPVDARSLMTRNAIKKNDFPCRKEPKNLLEGDAVLDTVRNKIFAVYINDPFKSEVITKCGQSVMYEYLKETSKEEEESEDFEEQSNGHIDVDPDFEIYEGSENIVEETDITYGSEALTSLATVFTPKAPLITTNISPMVTPLPMPHSPPPKIKPMERAVTPLSMPHSPPPKIKPMEPTDSESITVIQNDLLLVIYNEIKELRADVNELRSQNRIMNEQMNAMDMKVTTIDSMTNSIKKVLAKKQKRRDDGLKSVSFADTPMHHETVMETDAIGMNNVETDVPNNTEHEKSLEELIPPGGYLNFLNHNTNELIDYTGPPTSTPSNTNYETPQKTLAIQARGGNRATKFLKSELGKRYTEEELATSSINGGIRYFKSKLQEKNVLSPNRLQLIYTKARRQYKDEFDRIPNLNEVINSKCRKTHEKVSKRKEREKQMLD